MLRQKLLLEKNKDNYNDKKGQLIKKIQPL